MDSRRARAARTFLFQARARSLAAAATVLVLTGLVSPACSMQVEPVTAVQAPLFGATPAEAADWNTVAPLGSECTAVLLHPRLLVFAAHCGTDFETVVIDGVSHPLSACQSHPDAPTMQTGPGLIVTSTEVHPDLAFCLLEDAIDLQPIPPLVECERSALHAGTEVTMVGYGQDAVGAEYGTKRVATAHVTSVGHELAVAEPGVGSCPGDSGGPAFSTLPNGELRVVGILSSSPLPGCEENVSFYTNIMEHIAWLEASSGIDVTPCYDYAGTSRRRDECDAAMSCGKSKPNDLPAPNRGSGCSIASHAGLTPSVLPIELAIVLLHLAIRRRRRDCT